MNSMNGTDGMNGIDDASEKYISCDVMCNEDFAKVVMQKGMSHEGIDENGLRGCGIAAKSEALFHEYSHEPVQEKRPSEKSLFAPSGNPSRPMRGEVLV